MVWHYLLIPYLYQCLIAAGGAPGRSEAAPGRRRRVRHRRLAPRAQNMRPLVPPLLRPQLPRGVQPAKSPRHR